MYRSAAVLAVLLAGSLVDGSLGADPAPGHQVRVIDRAPDPHGTPRPARDAREVPLKTSLYVELGMAPEAKGDKILVDSVTLSLTARDGEPVELIRDGQFVGEASGWLRPRQVTQGLDPQPIDQLVVYAEPGESLRPTTAYTVRLTVRSRDGAELPEATGTWCFTTEAAPRTHGLAVTLDLEDEPVLWQGAFFSGFGNVQFATQKESYGPTYDLMAEARKEHPRAWSYQRDFWMTGSDFRPPGLFGSTLPNIVRERETRRITAIEEQEDASLLRVEDFFGHEQYGIPSGRPLSEDYQPGDEVLIADGVHDVRVKVRSVDDQARTVLVDPIATPEGGWKIAYERPLPEEEDPDAPGLFPPGGCYLRKFNPVGTPCYYWGRLDKEWDLAHRHYGRRLLPNFADATGDLARDGRSWTTVKDYAQWHDVARTIAGHIIDRYGEASLDFTWSIFNEPDLGPAFWRTDWDELQRYYDYTVDAILRAFEDRGYDSDRVFIGGLELGGIFGVHLKLTEFLAHCSPTAEAKGALPLNAAYADRRLDGKRSRRVEELCRAHDGKGSPCDFISIHAYNNSELMAAKLIRAKEMALEIDPEYYKDLWVNSHESCPDWAPPPDLAAADAYLGNGYFPTWCADVTARQLARAAEDPRYSFGETILTVWPPPRNFAGMNAVTRVVNVDDDGDGRGDRRVTIPMPIFNVLNLLSDFGDRYWSLPQQQIGGHVLGGFASRDEEGTVRVLLYAHHAQDTQSRSDAAFEVALDLEGLGWKGPAQVQEYRFDRDHNTYFREGRMLRDRPTPSGTVDPEPLAAAQQDLRSDDAQTRRAALKQLEDLGTEAVKAALPAILKMADQDEDEPTREAARAMLTRLFLSAQAGGEAYPAADVERIIELSDCLPTGSAATVAREPDTPLSLTPRLAGNGLNILVIRPADSDEPKP